MTIHQYLHNSFNSQYPTLATRQCIHSFDLPNHFLPLSPDEKCISLCQEISSPSTKDLKDLSYATTQSKAKDFFQNGYF